MAFMTSSSGTSALNISDKQVLSSTTFAGDGEQKIKASIWFCRKSTISQFNRFSLMKEDRKILILLHHFGFNRLRGMRHGNQTLFRNKFTGDRTDSVRSVLNPHQGIFQVGNVF